jgi:hypothetical protein
VNAEQIATLVRAVARLRIGDAGDTALIDALANLIEPAPSTVPSMNKRPMADDRRPRDPMSSNVAGAADLPRPPPAMPLPDAATRLPARPPRERKPAHDRLVAEPSVLERVTERADLSTPDRQAARVIADRPASAADAGGPVAPLESLFAPGRVRGILREMTTLTHAGGGPDIAAIVRLIARAQPPTRLPRLPVTTLGHSVQWLFDTGPSMLPFARDRQQLAATALRLLGRDRVRIADFIGHPLQAVRAQRQVQWGELRWPPRGSALVAVSDLGIGSRESPLLAPPWLEFIDECKRRRLRSVVLIPYEQARWPAVAAAFDTALTWDLDTGVQGLRRVRRLTHGR